MDRTNTTVEFTLSGFDPYFVPLVVPPNAPVPQLDFYVHDHLGNTRVVYNTSSTCVGNAVSYTLEMVVDYYPYGKVLREYVNGQTERFLTTQHERDVETGLDYRGARFYDSEVARFLSLDPAASEYPSLSDYCYVAGNPLMYIDPDGRHVAPIRQSGGKSNKAYNALQRAITSTLWGNSSKLGFRISTKMHSMLISSKKTYMPVLYNKTPSNNGGQFISRSKEGSIRSPYIIAFNTYRHPTGKEIAKNRSLQKVYRGVATTTVFEEFFHAAQHEHYTIRNGKTQTLLAKEVEAKAAIAISGLAEKDFEIAFANEAKDYIKAVQNGDKITDKLKAQYENALNNLAKAIWNNDGVKETMGSSRWTEQEKIDGDIKNYEPKTEFLDSALKLNN